MRILFNIIFSAILVIGLVGFWALFLNLWKPKKKWPAWVGYIIIIGAWFAAIRYYILMTICCRRRSARRSAELQSATEQYSFS